MGRQNCSLVTLPQSWSKVTGATSVALAVLIGLWFFDNHIAQGKDIPAVGDAAKGSTVVEVLTWKDRRGKMEDVCYGCHEQSVIDGHYEQFDNVVHLYNDKFAKPIAAVMGQLKEQGYITPAPFDDKIEWTWWEIWHHEGRRARHGRAAQAGLFGAARRPGGRRDRAHAAAGADRAG